MSRCVPVARIKKEIGPSTYRCTAHGDAFAGLGSFPVTAFIHVPKSGEDPVAPLAPGYIPKLIQASILSMVNRKDGVQIVITGHTVPDEQMPGAWIYMDSSLWAEAGSIYFYQIQGAAVHDSTGTVRGTVADFMDAAGDGVLVVLLNDGREIYLPNHEDFVNFERIEEKIIRVDTLEDFL